MRLHYSGKYSGEVADLPNQRMVPTAVKFREPAPDKIGIIGNTLSFLIASLTVGGAFLRTGNLDFFSLLGAILVLFSLPLHEFLHAICFREDVYFYIYLKQGMFFVVGEEDFERRRFALMSLLPNVVLGAIPYVFFLLNPQYIVLGTYGAIAIALGAGDYMNVFNALIQVPRDAKIFMHQMNTYWYISD